MRTSENARGLLASTSIASTPTPHSTREKRVNQNGGLSMEEEIWLEEEFTRLEKRLEAEAARAQAIATRAFNLEEDLSVILEQVYRMHQKWEQEGNHNKARPMISERDKGKAELFLGMKVENGSEGPTTEVGDAGSEQST
jgi:predicted nuclease with TOPRIM domain